MLGFLASASALSPIHTRLGSVSGIAQLSGIRESEKLLACSPENARSLRVAPWMQAKPSKPTVARAKPEVGTEVDNGRLRTVCVALLGQTGKIEDVIEEGGLDSRELDFEGFCALVDMLQVECTEEDKSSIFDMIDEDGSGSIDASELKGAVRSSGAITTMYEQSLQTFGGLIAATLSFAVGISFFKGGDAALDFITAYVVEDSLSVDNLFVFLLIFRYFKVPPQLVDTALNLGIAGSIILRGVFIFAGLAVIQAFSPLLLGFSAFLLYSSYQLLLGGDGDGEDDELPKIIVDILDRLPLTGTFEGEMLFVPAKDGQSPQLTQLTATLLCIAFCDVLFAVDSIPAVLAVNSDPFIVYTSNIAAVLGLRSLYQLLSIAVTDLVYLEKAVAVVLGFVGLKLSLEVAGYDVDSGVSLRVIISTLAIGVLLSLGADEEAKEQFQPNTYSFFLLFVSKVFNYVKRWKR